MFSTHARITLALIIALAVVAPPVMAQNEAPTPAVTLQSSGWHFMQDAVLFGMYNNQGGPRGGSEFKAPNWWMGMLSRNVGSSQITFNTMLSLDPATLDKQGYREIFQVGESFEGRAAHRPSASPRLLHAARRRLADAARCPHRLHARRGAVRGAGARACRVHASRLGGGQPPGAVVASHVRLDAYRFRCRDRGGRSWALDSRGFGVQRPGAGRTSMGFRFRPAGLGLREAVVSARGDLGVSGLGRPPQGSGNAGARRHHQGHGVGRLVQEQRRRFFRGDRRLWSELTEHGNRHAALVEATRYSRRNSLFMRAELVHVETSLLLADTRFHRKTTTNAGTRLAR